VTAADQVPLVADQQHAIRVDGPLDDLVATDRIVVEDHGLAVGDGSLQPRQPGAGTQRLACRQDAERRHDVLLEQLGAPLREAQQSQAQRFRVGETTLEDEQTGAERQQLLVGQIHGRQVVGGGRQAVQLAAVLVVGFAGDGDVEQLQLGTVFIEAPLEGVVGHQRIAFDLAADLLGAHRPVLPGQQVGDQRETPDELVGVLGEACFASRTGAGCRLR